MAELESLNLNLLVTLDALLRERSVTVAARHLGVTPSAASHALARLRELLGDALLVRTPGGMVPTPRAEALEAPLSRTLRALRQIVFEPPGFEPAASTRTFRISTSDLFAVFMAPVIARSRAEAPGVDLEIIGGAAEPFEGLASGAVDVAIGVVAPEAVGLLRLVLLRERFVCLVR
ncbi:MAG: LysR family transcriptional regulator, partial [bacterium]